MRDFHDITHLRANGIKVAQRSQWHYQVVGKRTTLNIWPSARKWMVQYDNAASLYRDAADLLRIVREKLRSPLEFVTALCAEQRARMDLDAWDAWKDDSALLSLDIYQAARYA